MGRRSVAASMLEADDSPVKGKMGYAHMPVNKTNESGLAVELEPRGPRLHEEQGRRDQVRQVGHEQGVHQARRREDRLEQRPAGLAYLDLRDPRVQGSRCGLRADHPRRDEQRQPEAAGREPQPWVGIQYVSIPEFQDVGNQCAQLVADYIANRTSVDDALTKCQGIAQKAATRTSSRRLALTRCRVAASAVPAPVPLSYPSVAQGSADMTTTTELDTVEANTAKDKRGAVTPRLDRPRAAPARLHLPHPADPDPFL